MTDQAQNHQNSTDLGGQVALVTGAAGLGRAIAQTLAAAGAKVACINVNAGLADRDRGGDPPGRRRGRPWPAT